MVKDTFLNEDEQLSFKKIISGFNLLKKKSGSFQAINFITFQLAKIGGVRHFYVEKGRQHSLVYYNLVTKTAFLFLMAYNTRKYGKRK